MTGRTRSATTALCFVGVLALAACAPAPAATTGTAADDTAIRAIGPAYAEAWNKGDVAAMVNFTTDDYDGVRPDGMSIKGRAGVEAEAKEGVAARAGLPLTLAIQTSMVRFNSATSAATGGTWTVSGAPAGSGGPEKGAWSATVVKGSDGQWRMATALVADYMPPPAPPAPAPAKGKGK